MNRRVTAFLVAAILLFSAALIFRGFDQRQVSEHHRTTANTWVPTIHGGAPPHSNDVSQESHSSPCTIPLSERISGPKPPFTQYQRRWLENSAEFIDELIKDVISADYGLSVQFAVKDKSIAKLSHFQDMPDDVQNVVSDSIIDRIGPSAYERIAFKEAIEYKPPYNNIKLKFRSRLIETHTKYLLTFVRSDPISGTVQNEAYVLLDSSLNPTLLQFSQIVGGIDKTTFLSFQEVLEVTRKEGFVALSHMLSPFVKEGHVVLPFNTHLYPVSPESKQYYKFCTAHIDMQTGELVGNAVENEILYEN